MTPKHEEEARGMLDQVSKDTFDKQIAAVDKHGLYGAPLIDSAPLLIELIAAALAGRDDRIAKLREALTTCDQAIVSFDAKNGYQHSTIYHDISSITAHALAADDEAAK